MMTGSDGMMGSMMAWMLGFSVLTWLLVLVILALAAVAVAVVLIAWAKSSGKLPSFFDKIIDQVSGSAG